MAEKKEIFTLHIDALPSVAKPAKIQAQQVHRKKSLNVELPAPVLPAPQAQAVKSRSLIGKIWEKVEFIFVSGAVFLVIYVILNWQALALNAEHYWDVWRGVKSPLEHLVADTENVPERLTPTVTASANGIADEYTIPPLEIEVYPTDMRVVIPRINQNVPVVGVKNENLIARRWEELEKDIQGALRSGVVHYPGTSLPGDRGNVVITGHSSYYAWDPGRFKDVFALLHDVQVKDRVVVYFNQKKFIYEVDKKEVVLPKDVDVLSATNHEQLTLITCTPIGTNLKRLVVTAHLVEQS